MLDNLLDAISLIYKISTIRFPLIHRTTATINLRSRRDGQNIGMQVQSASFCISASLWFRAMILTDGWVSGYERDQP